ncbi:MAG: molybdopterin molybdotransferase MoeA [Actinobacteria bacterium]|nr:molybdopterin molybdotransferase MoeA [Actinomycetota bacterium]
MDPQRLPRHDDLSSMISVAEAQERSLLRIEPLEPIALPLMEAFGCVLAGSVSSNADLPPFASSAMDGVAVRSEDVAAASEAAAVPLRIVGSALMGRTPDVVVGAGEAARIATGAPIPDGADCIVPIEDVLIAESTVQVLHASTAGKHSRPAGEDVSAGDELAPAGRRLGSPELGMFASAGISRVWVHPQPRVIVLSTGDELVDPGKPLEYGQIHDSNAFTLAGALKEAGAHPFLARMHDDANSVRSEIFSQLATADLFITTGGVSVGERDPVKGAFEGKGEIEFFRVAMQPGMPQAFGMIEGKPFFGLPGNPVSVFVSFEVFVRPALMKMMGRKQIYRPMVNARLLGEISGPEGKASYARVLVKRTPEGRTAEPTGGRSSNLFASVVRANGLAVIPPGVSSLSEGQECQVMVFRSLED